MYESQYFPGLGDYRDLRVTLDGRMIAQRRYDGRYSAQDSGWCGALWSDHEAAVLAQLGPRAARVQGWQDAYDTIEAVESEARRAAAQQRRIVHA